jgi:hypothetical protein
MANEDPKRSAWERVASALLIPLAIAFVGNVYSQAIKEREVQGEFVKLSVDILKQPPTEGTKSLREWAIRVINRYSGVSLSEEAKRELETVPLLSLRQLGDIGSDVAESQKQLIALGYLADLPANRNGVLGSSTQEAIRQFQQDIGISIDGLLGAATKTAIQSAYENLQKTNQAPSKQP